MIDDCRICGLPVEVERIYELHATGKELGTSASAAHRRVGCIGGHHYDELIGFFEEPRHEEAGTVPGMAHPRTDEHSD